MESTFGVLYSILVTLGLIAGAVMMMAVYYFRNTEVLDFQPTKISQPKNSFHLIDSWASLPTFGEEGHRYYVESTKTIYEWRDSHYSIVKHEHNPPNRHTSNVR